MGDATVPQLSPPNRMVVRYMHQQDICILFLERNKHRQGHLLPKNREGCIQRKRHEGLERQMVLECPLRDAILETFFLSSKPCIIGPITLIQYLLEHFSALLHSSRRCGQKEELLQLLLENLPHNIGDTNHPS